MHTYIGIDLCDENTFAPAYIIISNFVEMLKRTFAKKHAGVSIEGITTTTRLVRFVKGIAVDSIEFNVSLREKESS